MEKSVAGSILEIWLGEEPPFLDDDFWKNGKDKTSCEEYLDDICNKQNIYEAYNIFLKDAARYKIQIKGVIAELGGGRSWVSAELSKIPTVEKIYCVDFSSFLMEQLAPKMFHRLGAIEEKIVRVIGNFCSCKLPENSLDMVVLMMAYHHAKDERELLSEIKRILKPNGLLVILGEVPQNYFQSLRYWLKYLINLIEGSLYKGKFVDFNPDRVLVDPILGDFSYSVREYYNRLREFQFEPIIIRNTGMPFLKESYQPKNMKRIVKRILRIHSNLFNFYSQNNK